MPDPNTIPDSKEQVPPSRWGRSIAALLAGFVAVVILSLATDDILRETRIFPASGDLMSNPLFLLATIYRTLYGVLGSYITARVAPDRPMGHALAGGLVGLVLSLAGVAASWKHPELGPHWYSVALVLTVLPTAWLGGRMREIQIKKNS